MMRRLSLIVMVLMAYVSTYAVSPESIDTTAHRVKFAWGAEFGSSIDLSAHDMSSIDFNAAVGLSYRWLTFAGVGAGADIMVSNSCRMYPIFAAFRTSFSNRPQIVFIDVRGGVALNYLPHDVTQTGGYGSLGVGFNLARGRSFQSYLVAGYTFVDRRDVVGETGFQPYDPLNYAGIRLGVIF